MGWSKKYKKSINCNNPKGFSQKAHCAGRKKQENKMSLKLEELVGKKLTEQQFDEAAGKKDACYHKVKARYDVWPSAYASGALVKCRKVGAKNWGNKSKKENIEENKKLVGVAIGIAKKMGGNMTGAVEKIEKLSKGLSKVKPVQDALRKANEGLADKFMKNLDKYNKKAKKSRDAMKKLKKKEGVNEGRVLHFTQIKDKTLEKHLKVIAKKVGAVVSKIPGGFKVDADSDGRKLAQVVDYIFDKSLMKGLMSGGGMSRVQLVNENSKVYQNDVDQMVTVLSAWEKGVGKYTDGNIFMGKDLQGKKPEPFATSGGGEQSGGKKDALKALVKRWKKLDVKPQTTTKIFNSYHKLPDSKKKFSNPDFWEDFLEKNGISVVY